MSWDAYLILKTAGVAVLIFAGGLSASKNLPVSKPKAFFINTMATFAGFTLSRLWYIIQHLFGSDIYEFRSMSQAWDAWTDAGSVLYGWTLGGTAAVILLTRLFKINTIRYLDCTLKWFLMAQFLNRLGCLDAGCCFGKLTEFTVSIPSGAGQIHPVQFYEALFDLGLFFVVRKYFKRQGMPTFIYFMGYPTARFFLEFLRGDNQPAFLYMTVPQIASILIVATVLLLRKYILSPTR